MEDTFKTLDTANWGYEIQVCIAKVVELRTLTDVRVLDRRVRQRRVRLDYQRPKERLCGL
jgi:hypothetical protein